VSDTLQRMTDEFRRLDDELAAAVTLPAVDKVIRRAGSMNRASTAAAAAVLTVGTLSGLTAVAQASTPAPSSDVAAPVLPPAASTPTETTQSPPPSFSPESQPVAIDVPAPVYAAPARPAPGPVLLPPPAPPVPPAPEKKPSGGKEGDSDNNNDNNDHDKPTKPTKPTPPTKPTKPPTTEPTQPPTSEPPTSEPSDPPSSQPQDPPSSEPQTQTQTKAETTGQ
jgi:hypothetical protein